MKKTFIVIFLSCLAACGTYKSISPTQNDVDRGATKFPGLTLSQLNEGKATFESNCGKCHGLGRPFNVSVNALEKIMPEMAAKAGIDNEKSDRVLKYLITMKIKGTK